MKSLYDAVIEACPPTCPSAPRSLPALVALAIEFVIVIEIDPVPCSSAYKASPPDPVATRVTLRSCATKVPPLADSSIAAPPAPACTQSESEITPGVVGLPPDRKSTV